MGSGGCTWRRPSIGSVVRVVGAVRLGMAEPAQRCGTCRWWAGRSVVLWFARRRWRCPDGDCAVNTWSEHVEAIAARASLTERARARVADKVNIEGWTIAGAAVEFGVGWHTANQAVAEFSDPVIDDPDRLEGVTAIGVDEKRFTNAKAGKSTTFTTQIVDLDQRCLLDVVAGRSGVALVKWLGDRGSHWCSNITLATLDPAAGCRRAGLVKVFV